MMRRRPLAGLHAGRPPSPTPTLRFPRTACSNALLSPPTLRTGETVAMIALSAACVRLQKIVTRRAPLAQPSSGQDPTSTASVTSPFQLPRDMRKKKQTPLQPSHVRRAIGWHPAHGPRRKQPCLTSVTVRPAPPSHRPFGRHSYACSSFTGCVFLRALLCPRSPLFLTKPSAGPPHFSVVQQP